MPASKTPESNLHFFTGENDFTLRRELRRWKTVFVEKHGAENLLEMSGKTASFSELLDAVSAMPFLAEKRLIIVEGLPPLSRDEFREFTGNIHPQVVVAIVDPKPDKRLGAVKEITAVADVKLFPLLSEREIVRWLNDQAAELPASIDDAAVRALIAAVGTDQWMLLQELKKLALFAGDVIRSEHVEAMTLPAGDQVIWKFTDLIGSRNPQEAITFFHRRLDRGEDAYAFWTILLNALKNLALVWSAIHDGSRDDRSIASAFGLNPFAIRGLMPLARALTASQLKKIVDAATEADLALKTGGHHYSAERQGELIALIERVILLCD